MPQLNPKAGRYRLVGEDDLDALTQQGWELVQVIVEKKFLSTHPHWDFGNPIVCVECRIPVVDKPNRHGPQEWQRGPVQLVEIPRFLLRLNPESALALAEQDKAEMGNILREEAKKATAATKAQEEAEKQLAIAEESLRAHREDLAVAREWSELHARQRADLEKCAKQMESVIADARNEIGNKRWRELFGEPTT
jgi:hypothetical protein